MNYDGFGREFMFQQLNTPGGVTLEVEQSDLDYNQGIRDLITALDTQRGAIFASSYEYPGRYTTWDIGFCNPPLVITCKHELIEIAALNIRGEILLSFFLPQLRDHHALELIAHTDLKIHLRVKVSREIFCEEERSKQPSVFTLIRQLLSFLHHKDEPYLGLYGAFGYDLIHQFEDLEQHKARDPNQRDLVLYLPDEIYVVNHRKESAFIRRYEFQWGALTTRNAPRTGEQKNYYPAQQPLITGDHREGEYAKSVEKARESFARGDLFEVVTSQTFYRHYDHSPSHLFELMSEINPSPYGFFINLGEGEYLVGASPEMYVRVTGTRVETCPISGTIKRGKNAIEDAENIQSLLVSKKEESELTMCTDVDRNDKSRICEAGSVKVIGRRQIEMYSRVIHTVDHVEGELRPGFDAVDAFLTHMWVVTVTGAPKLWAMSFIEQHEKSPRRWYGGAVGWFGVNGDLNTGLILRTVRLEEGVAEVRVGATLLYDSIPEAEEEEIRLKASAFLDILQATYAKPDYQEFRMPAVGKGARVLLIDHQDSFVHTLANYFRQTGAEVLTVRFDRARYYLETETFNLVVLSPGPGSPKDFNLSGTIAAVLHKNIPLFGVCLGLQGIVEYFGGTLNTLSYPMHGKASEIRVVTATSLFKDLEPTFKAGRYHSLYASIQAMPSELTVTAVSDDEIIMAIMHHHLPIQAVQFHPETILSLSRNAGQKIIFNLMQMVMTHAN